MVLRCQKIYNIWRNLLLKIQRSVCVRVFILGYKHVFNNDFFMVFVDKPAILALANASHIRNVAWVMSNTTKSCVLHCCVYCIFYLISDFKMTIIFK